MRRTTGARAIAITFVAAWALAATPARASEDPGEPLDSASGAGLFVGWDLRAEGSGLFKRYTRNDGRVAWAGGPTGGVEASASLHFRTPSSTGGALAWTIQWVDFEFGVATAQRYASYAGDTGRTTSFFENDTAIIAATHFAWGHAAIGHAGFWSTTIVGLAWAPTAVFFFGNGEFASGGRFNPAGLRAMLDLGSVADRGGGHPSLRICFTWLPFVADLPSEVAAGAGVVFY